MHRNTLWIGGSVGAFMVLILFLAAPAVVRAVMPPEHYEKSALQSKIKAVAVVENINVLDTTKRRTHKEVRFRLVSAITPGTPDTFTGACYSVDHLWQEPGAGGEIYFYPEKGSRVFVTIAADGGWITSYTVLSRQLEEAILSNPERIRFRMGKVSLVGEK